MFNAYDVKLELWRCVWSRCLSPRVEEHTIAFQRMQYHYQYQCVGQRKKALCVLSLPSHKDLSSHTYMRKSTTTDCVSETVQWRSLAWMSNHHRLALPPPLLIPIHRLCGCGSSAGLDRCAPPHPP